jgi:hypothetical protein
VYSVDVWDSENLGETVKAVVVFMGRKREVTRVVSRRLKCSNEIAISIGILLVCFDSTGVVGSFREDQTFVLDIGLF